jgi:hypothetical protein
MNDHLMRAALRALEKQIDALLSEPGHKVELTAEHRGAVIAFAEKNANPRVQHHTDRAQINELAAGRIQALHIAGEIALLDGRNAANPFRDPELRAVYGREQQFQNALTDPSRQQAAQHHEHARASPQRDLER